MAGKNILGALAKKPLGFQLAILGGVIVALGFGYWQFFYSGLQEEQAAAASRKKSTNKKIDELREDAKELEALMRERPERKLKIEKGILKLPAKSELPAFLRQLQNQAGAAGVKLRNYAQQPEIAVDAFIKVPYKIEASGTFYQLSRYFWLLWEYSKSDSGLIITIENLKLSDAAASADGILLTANFNASTFRQADAGEELPAAAAEPAKADKQKAGEPKQKAEGAADKGAGESKPGAAPAGAAPAGDKAGAGKAGADKAESGKASADPGAENIR